MGSKALVPDQHRLIKRKNPTTGLTERIVYTGSLRFKPKGWRVVRRV